MISVLIPSRSRPEKAFLGVNSLFETADGPIEVLLYLNNDDPSLEEYNQLFIELEYPGIFSSIVGPDQPTSYSWNKLAKYSTGDILMMGGDDSVMLTKGWDTAIEGAIDDDLITLVSFDDGRLEMGYPNWAITREWYNALGYFVFPEFIHYYVDTWNTGIAEGIGRLRYLPDVVYEHRHFKVGKAEKDAIYKRVRGKSGINEHDRRVFESRTLMRKVAELTLQEIMNV